MIRKILYTMVGLLAAGALVKTGLTGLPTWFPTGGKPRVEEIKPVETGAIKLDNPFEKIQENMGETTAQTQAATEPQNTGKVILRDPKSKTAGTNEKKETPTPEPQIQETGGIILKGL